MLDIIEINILIQNETTLFLFHFFPVTPRKESPLLDEKSPAHVAAIKVLKLEEVIVHIHKAEDYRSEYTESQECEDNVDLLVVNVVPVEKGIISWTLYVRISYTKVLKVTL